MYNHTNSNSTYGTYYQGQNYGNGHSPQGYIQNSTSQAFSPQNYPGGQPQSTYAGQTGQGYPANPQQSPQNYQGSMGHPNQTYQGVTGQTPQGYQVNVTASQACAPNVAQSPRSFQPAQSPNNFPTPSGLSPSGYRQVQSQSPPIGPVHTSLQYHHPQQIQQYQQHQQQQQHHQQHQQQQHQHHQQQQQPPQHQQQQQQHQQHIQNSVSKNEQQSPNNNGNSGMPHQSPEQNENRSTPSCIRQGCTNPAIANSEWEDEYCSNECVVSHCRDVFSSWVASNTNNQIQNFSAVK